MTLLDDEFARALSRLELAVARVRARSADGSRRAGPRGGVVEFAGHRPYAPGDDVRRVDWLAEARTGRLHVKEHEKDEDLDVVLVADASGSMETGGKFDAARRLAYALGWLALRGGARVRFAAASDGDLRLSESAQGAAGAAILRRAVETATCGGGTRLSASLARLPAAQRGTRLVYVLSDLLADDDGRTAMAALAEHGDDVVVLHVHAASDLSAADDGDVVLEDAETGRRVAADASAAARARETVSRAAAERAAFAARRRFRIATVDASAPLDEAAVLALRAAGVLA